MEIFLLDTSNREIVSAQLLPAVARDMRNLTDGWMFIEPPQGTVLIEKYIERNGETNANDLEVMRELEELENDPEDDNDPGNNQ